MRISWTLAASLLFFAPFASADSIQLSVHSSVTLEVSSPNDNWYGTYSNVPGSKFFDGHPTVEGGAFVPFSNVSILLPTGSIFEDASVSVTAPTDHNPAIGTGHKFTAGKFEGEINHSLPSIAPTFSGTGVSEVWADSIFYSGGTKINGDLVSTNIQNLDFGLRGIIDSALLNPGSNWAGYLGGSGEVVLPYTVELTVDYSPVPEPSSFALFGTGLLGLSEVVRRKIRSS
jgi:hypothetical protein